MPTLFRCFIDWIPQICFFLVNLVSVQFSSVTQSCSTICDPMEHSMPGLPVHHQLLEFTQTHVHRVGDAIQPSHLLSSPSPPAFSLSQHHGLFKWVSSSKSGGQSIGVSASASVLPMNIQDGLPLGWTGLISLLPSIVPKMCLYKQMKLIDPQYIYMGAS